MSFVKIDLSSSTVSSISADIIFSNVVLPYLDKPSLISFFNKCDCKYIAFGEPFENETIDSSPMYSSFKWNHNYESYLAESMFRIIIKREIVKIGQCKWINILVQKI